MYPGLRAKEKKLQMMANKRIFVARSYEKGLNY